MNKTLLIIEDDQDTSFILGIIAEQLALTVVHSARALNIEEIEKIAPNLILLDHWVGDQLGGDLCVRLKAGSTTKQIPVIMLSANNNLEKIAADACADAFIAKPFDVDELSAVIMRFLG